MDRCVDVCILSSRGPLPLLIYCEGTRLQVKYSIWYNYNICRVPYVFTLRARPLPMVRPMYTHEGIGGLFPHSCPMQRGFHRGLRHRLLVPRGIVPKVGSCPRSSIAWSLCGAEGHGPDCWGQGTRPVWMAFSSSPLLWILIP